MPIMRGPRALLAAALVAVSVTAGCATTDGSPRQHGEMRDADPGTSDAGSFRSAAPRISLGSGFVTWPGVASAWIRQHPRDPRAAKFRAVIANRPAALWLTGNESFGNLRQYVALAKARKGTMVLTTWNIPGRWDGLSARSRLSSAGYATWIKRVATTIGRTRAVLVLEPDALWFYDRLANKAARTQRKNAIAGAIRTLHRYAPNTRVYLEAGTASGSVRPQRMAAILRGVGVASAAGFAVNVSSYAPNGRIYAYAQAIRNELHRLGLRNPRYVIDTGRNGRTTWDNTWCNPANQRIGFRPQLIASKTGTDFRLWIKEPGTSDGDCGAGRGSYGGQFLPKLAWRMIH